MCMHTKFHANRTIFGEVITFHKFSRWRPPRSRDITICNSGPHMKSPRWSELAVQIWFLNLDYFGYITILVFCHFACKMPNYAHFLVNFGLNLIIVTPKRHIIGWKRVVWAINRDNQSRGSTWARIREKKQDRTTKKKAQQRNMWGEAPANDNATKFGTGVDVQDVITHAKF